MKSAQSQLDTLLASVERLTPQRLKILIPVSGGSDSALVFWLYTKLFKERVTGVFFGDTMRREDWFTGLGEVRKLSYEETTDREVIRWSQCLTISLAESRLLIGTRNRTEHVLGIYSQASRVAYHLPIAGVWKSDVLSMGELIGVPNEILISSREADIDCGRPPEYAHIPLEHVDIFTQSIIGEADASKLTLISEPHRMYLQNLYVQNRFKESFPVLGPAV